MISIESRSIAVAVAFVVVSWTTACAAAGADDFYPAEEVSESGAIVWPRLVELRTNDAVLEWPGEPARTLRIGARYRECELVGVILQAAPLAVLERDFPGWGVLEYVGSKGPVATLRKAVGKMENLVPANSFPPQYFDRILDAQADVLGREILAHAEGPSYETTAGLLPPLEAYTFLGTTTSRQKVMVWPDGRLGFGVRAHQLEQVLFDPRTVWGDAARALAATKQGLVGGYLPVIDYGFFDAAAHSGWEEMAFSAGQDELATYVCLHSLEGRREYWRLPERAPLENGTEFYRALLDVHDLWERFFAKGIRIKLPDARVSDASRAAVVRALISEVGLHPKYGAGNYWARQHETFPPATILLNQCLFDWGYAEEVKARLGYYLSHFVMPDGTFDYYGPAISEYGQMLALAARYVRLSGDTAWLHENLPALERIAGGLQVQMETSRQRYPPDSPYYGLLFGAAEADTRKDTKFYFSSDLWCWRGLVELGELLSEEGRRGGDAALAQRGKTLLGEADTFYGIVHVALQRAFQKDPAFLAPIAGLEAPFGSMTEGRLASYTNYRYWPEMLSAGMLPAEMRDAIIAFRTTRGGELAGTTRFANVLDDWPYTHYAWGLMEADQTAHYLLGFYGHLAFHEAPGTFTAYESAEIKGNSTRAYASDYCVPAQLVTPQLLRWMLVWEPWDKQELWLARAVPASWFTTGFSVTRVPTRWGAVSLEVAPSPNGLRAQVELDSPHPEQKVFLRLPPGPSGTKPKLTVTGTDNWKWDSSREAVELDGAWKKITISRGN